MYEAKVYNPWANMVETVVTDKDGLNGLVLNGFDIIEVKKV